MGSVSSSSGCAFKAVHWQGVWVAFCQLKMKRDCRQTLHATLSYWVWSSTHIRVMRRHDRKLARTILRAGCTSPPWPMMIVKQSPLPLLRGLEQEHKVSFNNMITSNEKFTGLTSPMHLAREMACSTHGVHGSRSFYSKLLEWSIHWLDYFFQYHYHTKYLIKTQSQLSNQSEHL